jgi:hypothetical protein
MRWTSRRPELASPASVWLRSATRPRRSAIELTLPVRGPHRLRVRHFAERTVPPSVPHDGFNTDERERRAFDLVWAHIAGAGQGSFNERFARARLSSFPATRFPYTDAEQVDATGERTASSRAIRRLRPKVIYTKHPVEYWGQGRRGATHTTHR